MSGHRVRPGTATLRSPLGACLGAVVATLGIAGAGAGASADAQPAWLDAVASAPAETVTALLATTGDPLIDVDARDGEGRRTLLIAFEDNPDPAVARLLLDAGADPNARDQRGMTPLLVAITLGRPAREAAARPVPSRSRSAWRSTRRRGG